jgi:hypothetical protein
MDPNLIFIIQLKNKLVDNFIFYKKIFIICNKMWIKPYIAFLQSIRKIFKCILGQNIMLLI